MKVQVKVYLHLIEYCQKKVKILIKLFYTKNKVASNILIMKIKKSIMKKIYIGRLKLLEKKFAPEYLTLPNKYDFSSNFKCKKIK